MTPFGTKSLRDTLKASAPLSLAWEILMVYVTVSLASAVGLSTVLVTCIRGTTIVAVVEAVVDVLL